MAATQAPALTSGQASGTLSVGDKSAKLTFSTAFVDGGSKDTFLVLSDTKLPDGWKSSGDMMMWSMDHKFMGVKFRMNAKGDVIQTDYYDATAFPTSTSGLIDLKLTSAPGGKTLAGSASTTKAAATQSKPIKLDVTFTVTLK